MLIFFIESAVELDLSAIICLHSMSTENFDSYTESFSTVSAMIVVALNVVLPYYLIKVGKRYFLDTQNGV